jgi:hypothetical protein
MIFGNCYAGGGHSVSVQFQAVAIELLKLIPVEINKTSK